MMFSTAVLLTAAVVVAAAVYKLWQLRRSATVTSAGAGYSLVTCLIALAVALALQPPPIEASVDAVLGASATSLVLAPALAMIATCGYQCFLISINDPSSAARRIRLRMGIVALALITLVAAVAVTGPAGHLALRAQDPVSYRSDLSGAVVFLAYIGYMGFGALDTARLAYRFARLGDVPLLRLGLLMVTAGTYLSGLYVALKLAGFATGLIIDRNLDLVVAHATRPLVLMDALLISVGSTLPSWGRFLGARRPAEWVSLYISHLTLRPLWEALYAVKPQIALDPRSRWADRLLPADLRFRITRRVVEIRDGLLLLRPYRTPEVHTRATELAHHHGLPGTDPAAAVEAIEIALCLQALNHIDTTNDRVEAASPFSTTNANFDGVTANITDEIHWLSQVTHAFQHSPAVHDTSGAAAPSINAS